MYTYLSENTPVPMTIMLERFFAYRTEKTVTVVAIASFQRDAIERTKLILYKVKENDF